MALLMGAVAAYLGTSVATGVAVSGAAYENRAVTVPTVEEAQEVAGFDVTAPNYLPDGFERSNFEVITLLTKNQNKSVVQTWVRSGENDDYIMLEQAPDLTGIAAQVSPVTIRGILGERALRPIDTPTVEEFDQLSRPLSPTDAPTVEESDQLSLFWRESGIGFALVGSLSTSQTEEDLIRIAESIFPQ